MLLNGKQVPMFFLKCVFCGKEYSYNSVDYICPDCGNNLDVIYDYNSIKKKFKIEDLKNNKNYTIWRYFPILPYHLPSAIYHLPSLPIGWTPLHKATNLEKTFGLKNLYLKDDTKTPSCSFKDRASAVVVVKGQELYFTEKRKLRTENQKTTTENHIVYTTASTGNAGCALACICANLQLPCVIFVPETAPKGKIAQLLIFGAKVIAVRGNYDDAFNLSLEASKEFGWYCRSTGYNPYTREGKKTASYEIVEQLGWKVPDKVFVPVGDGNILSGIWKGFLDFYKLGFIDKLPQIIGVQSKNSNAISRAVIKYERLIYSPKKKSDMKNLDSKKIKIEPVNANTVADSICVDMPKDGISAVKSIIESRGFVIEVSDEEILEAVKIIAEKEGIFSEPAGATSFAGLKRLIQQEALNPDEDIVCLVTGNGLKDIQSAMKIAGEPIVIEPSLEELKKHI